MDRGQHGLGAVRAAWMSAALAAMMLAGCGGGDDDTAAGEAQTASFRQGASGLAARPVTPVPQATAAATDQPPAVVEPAAAGPAAEPAAAVPVAVAPPADGQAVDPPTPAVQAAAPQAPAASAPATTRALPIDPNARPLPTSGQIHTTGRALDMGLAGDGAFVLVDPASGRRVLSRHGRFDIDAQARLINSEGWLLAGTADALRPASLEAAAPLPPIRVMHPPAATRKVVVELNLDARHRITFTGRWGASFDAIDAQTYNAATAVNVHDIKGQEVSLTLFFQKAATDTWFVYVSANGSNVNPDMAGAAQPVATLRFPANGAAPIWVDDVTKRLPPVLVNVPATSNFQGAVTEPIDALEIDLSTLTQYGATFRVTNIWQDGYAAGALRRVSILHTGTVVLDYDNGQSDKRYSLVLARTTVADRLQRFGVTGWLCGAGCQPPVVDLPGRSLNGYLVAGALNASW